MGTIIVFIAVFFAATGVYAIHRSIQNLGHDKSDSSLDMNGFKISAPAGFIYGIVALSIVVLFIKFSDKIIPKSVYDESGLYEVSYNSDSTFVNVKFSSNRPASIFNGKVLIKYMHRSNVYIDGIIGISQNSDSVFTGNSTRIDEGQKFYFMTKDSTIWGVNIIRSGSPLEFEVYKE